MDDLITLHDLVNNPTGKHTRNVGARYMIRDAIKAKYLESMKNPAKRKQYFLSITRQEDNDFLLWFKIPSEKYDVRYDVILRLKYGVGARSVASGQVQIYCNSPGWALPYGYVARKDGLLLPGWEKALGKAGKEPPKVINPDMQYGFDKTTYRAFLLLTGAAGVLTVADLNASVTSSVQIPKPTDPAMSVEAKLFEYERAKAKYDAEQREIKLAAQRAKEKADRVEAAKKVQADNARRTHQRRPAVAAKTAKSVKSVSSVKSRTTSSRRAK